MSRLIKNSLTIAVLALSVFVLAPIRVHAQQSGSNFKADHIIDDSVFYDGNAMTASQIQQFLNSKVPVCDTNGTTGPYYDAYGNRWNSRGEFGASRGSPPPYTCLKDFRQNTPAKSDSGLCAPIPARSNRTAAQIIDDVARACNVSQKALIVTLEKEQSFITDTWPWPIQYQKAMGYYCPDDPNRPGWCHPDYAGFFNQVYNAARQFQRYKQSPSSFNHALNRTSYVAYQANAPSCGGTYLTMRTAATAALYNYTPYQPNRAALNNLYGTGDSCSAYGNRNFWRIFNDWFGSTHATQFVRLDDPRWLQLKINTQKRHVDSDERFGPELVKGRHIFFPDKIYRNGKWYLRTQWDKDNNNNDGIPLDELEEIRFTSIGSKWVTTISNTRKVDPLRNNLYEEVDSMTAIEVTDQILIDGSTYYRTAYEKSKNRARTIKKSDTVPFEFRDMIKPREFVSSINTTKVNIQTKQVRERVLADTVLFFNKRLTHDGELYIQAASDNNTPYAIPMSSLKDVPENFVDLISPRWLQLKINTQKRHVDSDERFGPELVKGRHIFFPDKIYRNGKWYLRTQWDKDNNNNDGIPLDELEEIR